MLLIMGVAKIADIAADWVVVVKLLLGHYSISSDVAAEMGWNANATNVTHTHTQVLESAEGHDHATVTVTHTHEVPASDLASLFEMIIAMAITAAVLGTIIEVIAMIVTCRKSSAAAAEGNDDDDDDDHGDFCAALSSFLRIDDFCAAFSGTRHKKTTRNKWLAMGRFVMDDLPAATVALYLLVYAEFELADAILLGLSGGYSLLAFLYHMTRKCTIARFVCTAVVVVVTFGGCIALALATVTASQRRR